MAEKGKVIDRILDFLLKKRNLYLIGILAFALILRLFITADVSPIADEMNVAVRSIDVHNSGTMNSIDQSHSFYFLVEVFYKIFGSVSLFAARFSSVFFGLLSILMIYLIVMKLYKNEKIALIACFLIAVSGFQLRYTLAEMDITMAFFVLLSSYSFLLAVYDSKEKMYYLSALFLALAVAIKTFAGIWVLSYFFFALYYSRKNKEYKEKYIGKKGIKIVIFCALIIFLFILPTIIANYYLYKDKGIVDLQVSRFLNINKDYYKGLGGIDSPFMVSQLMTGINAGYISFTTMDLLISILALLGLIFTFRKYKEAKVFLLLWFIFAFLFIAGTAYLPTHFVYFTLIFAIFAAAFIHMIDEWIIKKFNFKQFLIISLIVIALFNIWTMSPYLFGKTAVSSMTSWADKNIESNSLVIVDQRIFRGWTALIFNNKAYVEMGNLDSVLNILQSSGEQEARIKTYFVECVSDDCGWGTIKYQPELNKSMESQVSLFSNLSSEKKDIYGKGYDESKTNPTFRVYTTYINAKPSILNLVYQTHYHYFYPVAWRGQVYDRYQVYTNFSNLLNKMGFFIFYLTIFLEIISPFILIYFFIKLKKENE